jgi:tRNA G18 (ribose-2'-O)-methylase SpoU
MTTMARVEPFAMSLAEQRALLAPLRGDLSVAVVRAKNPFNIGAIIRVAHSFLLREIILIGGERYYVRASMGMHRYENIVECADEEAFLAHLAGRPLLGVERDHADTTLWQVDYPPGVVLLFGNEDDGIPASLLAASERVLAIPMYGINHSLPVAVAVGMVLCEWARRRDPRGAPSSPSASTIAPARPSPGMSRTAPRQAPPPPAGGAGRCSGA